MPSAVLEVRRPWIAPVPGRGRVTTRLSIQNSPRNNAQTIQFGTPKRRCARGRAHSVSYAYCHTAAQTAFVCPGMAIG
jgi:hypothetical protein